MGWMVHWYESSIDRQLREATERGEFDNLAGVGKPLPGHGSDYAEDWWVKEWLEREGATAGAAGAAAPTGSGSPAPPRTIGDRGDNCWCVGCQ
jgi:Domain of unknown function (DUF1992)